MEKIIEIINEQNDIKIDKEEMEKFLSSTFLDITYEEGYLYESLPPFEYGSEIFIDEMKTLLENQSLKPYYVPPKEEFLKYRDVSYFEKNKEYNNLHKYFCKKTHNNKKLASIICDEIHYNCTRGVSFQNIFDYMESFNIIFDSEKDAKTCIDMIVKLNNNTRMMENRGHTAAEISKWRSSILSQSNKKISRNEPCPCGSGKKYKKCCGK